MEHLFIMFLKRRALLEDIIITKDISPNFRGNHLEKYCKKALLKCLGVFTEEK